MTASLLKPFDPAQCCTLLSALSHCSHLELVKIKYYLKDLTDRIVVSRDSWMTK